MNGKNLITSDSTLLDFFNPDAFNFGEMANREEGQHFIYYSFVTLTTLGYGDIIPIGHIRFTAGSEALTGLVLIAWTASFTYLQMQKLVNNK